jgi:hypothetical protein
MSTSSREQQNGTPRAADRSTAMHVARLFELADEIDFAETLARAEHTLHRAALETKIRRSKEPKEETGNAPS